MPRASETASKVRRALSRPGAVPTQREFAEELVKLAGGPRQLARVIWQEFQSERCTPAVKTKVLEMLLRVLRGVEKESPPADPAAMTDDELEAFILDRVNQMEGQAGGEVAV